MNTTRNLAALCTFLLAGTAIAQEQVWNIIPQNRTPVIAPGRRAPAVVSLKEITARADLRDTVSATTITMTIANSGGRMEEAQVLIPVPEGAAIRDFQLEGVGGPEPTARLLPRDEARRIYDSIVAASRDPGLLEFVGTSVIKSSVFPIPAQGEQVVKLTYEQILPSDTTDAGTRIDYVLPRTDSLQASGAKWSFSASFNSKRPVASIYSPTHELSSKPGRPNFTDITTVSAGAAGTLRMSIVLAPAERQGFAYTTLLYPDPEIAGGKGGYFMLVGGFPPVDRSRQEKVLREVTIVLDRSGSMRGEKIEQAREGALQVLEGLREGEYFNIIDYSDSVQTFASAPVRKGGESMAQAREYLKQITANGGTNIHDALVEALRQKPAAGALPVVLFLTDGLPTIGRTKESEIREAAEKVNTHERRIFTFGVGLDVNSPLLSRLSDVTRGVPTFVLPQEDVEVKVGQVFRRLSGPVLAGPSLVEAKHDDGPPRSVREVLPRTLPDVFDGDQVIILGQYTEGSKVELMFTGNYLGEGETFGVVLNPADASTTHAFVPRLWATRRIAELTDHIRQNATDGRDPSGDPKTKELVDEIVRLSTRWGILSEYTAFLVEEAPGTRADARRMQSMPAAGVPMTAAPARAAENIYARTRERSGAAGVNQEKNFVEGKFAAQIGQKQAWYDKDLNRVEATGVQQVADRTFLWRNAQWVDSRLGEAETQKPDQVVEFGTPEYTKLVDELAGQRLQGVLAMIGDVYLLQNGQRILIKMPPEG